MGFYTGFLRGNPKEVGSLAFLDADMRIFLKLILQEQYDRRLIRVTFGAGVLYVIQINHQPDATVFQFIILTFVYSSICFGGFPAHHQELNDFSGSLWFYLRIVVTVVLCSWSGRL